MIAKAFDSAIEDMMHARISSYAINRILKLKHDLMADIHIEATQTEYKDDYGLWTYDNDTIEIRKEFAKQLIGDNQI